MTQSALPSTNVGPLPGLNIVIVTPGFPDTTLRNALIGAIAAAGGQIPVMKSDSESAMRAHYAPTLSKAIINTASERMQDVIGFHNAVIAIEVSDQVAAANRAKEVFERAGFPATVHTHAEPEFPDGFLTFVSVPALRGTALMFWPNTPPPPEVITTLPKRLPWTAEDLVL